MGTTKAKAQLLNKKHEKNTVMGLMANSSTTSNVKCLLYAHHLLPTKNQECLFKVFQLYKTYNTGLAFSLKDKILGLSYWQT